MTIKLCPAPPLCDYQPVTGTHDHISFGTIEAGAESPRRRLEDALRVADALTTAVAFCMHLPARSWGLGDPHAHLLIPCRVLLPGSGFGRFIPILTDPLKGRAFIDAAWRLHLEEAGYDL